MFTQIFKCSRTIERHLAGPLVEPRLRYLTHYAEQGAALDTLQQIADSLLVIAEQMNLSPEGEVRREEIIAAADRWAGRQPRHPSMTHTKYSRSRFISVATYWLEFLGRLAPIASPPRPYAHLVTKFADYLSGEKGLAPLTIKTECWHVEHFLHHLYAQHQSLDELAIKDIDEALILKRSQGARFYPMLYMLTRVCRARDWESGVELSGHLLGKLSRLQIHHIFPKALLYKHGYSGAEVNAIANFTFLTQETNLLVSDRDPADYLDEFTGKNPGAIESHWIPMDRDLWKVERYSDFLAARRELLAKVATDFLESLLGGVVPESPVVAPVLEQTIPAVASSLESDEEERIIRDCNEWIVQQGLPEGEYMYELADHTGNPIAILDLAWPNGLQEGYSQPVALLINEGQEVEEAVNRAGYLFFTDADAFHTYVLKEILANSALDSLFS